MTTTDPDVSCDPYDFEIDRRLRNERPLPYNQRYDFYALSHFDDVEQAFVDWSWDVDLDSAVQARTLTVRSWERLPVVAA